MKYNKSLTLLGLIVVLIVMSATVFYGWYVLRSELEGTIEDGVFEGSVTYWLKELAVNGDGEPILGGDGKPTYTGTLIDITKDDVMYGGYNPATGLYSLDAGNMANQAFIGHIVVKVNLTKIGLMGRLRFLIMDEWLYIRTHIDGTIELPTVIPNEYIEGVGLTDRMHIVNQGNYRKPFPGKIYYYRSLLVEGETLDIEIINGADHYQLPVSDFYTDEAWVEFKLQIEVVQSNRFSEIWGLPANFFD